MRIGNNSDKEWEKLSEKDRYYWVTTFNKYRDDRMSDERRTEFFEEASGYLDNLLKVIRQHLDPSFQIRRALDFGCGTGRIAIPMADVADEVVGLDIAEGMLSEARANRDAKELKNITFGISDDVLSNAPGTFNFIHSIYVLQHIPFSRAKQILKSMLSHLEDGGVLSLQCLISNDLSRVKRLSYWMRVNVPGVKNILNLINRKKWSEPMMQLNSYPLNIVIQLLRQAGCAEFYLRPTKDGPYNGVIIMAVKHPECRDDFVDLGEIP